MTTRTDSGAVADRLISGLFLLSFSVLVSVSSRVPVPGTEVDGLGDRGRGGVLGGTDAVGSLQRTRTTVDTPILQFSYLGPRFGGPKGKKVRKVRYARDPFSPWGVTKSRELTVHPCFYTPTIPSI